MPADYHVDVCILPQTIPILSSIFDIFIYNLLVRFLSQAVSFQVIAWVFKIGVTTAYNIVYETCDVLFDCLAPVYLAPPSTLEWQNIADEFERVWNLPNCVSSIDGKHINIECPSNAGSEYFNYKGHHSVILLAACDAN